MSESNLNEAPGASVAAAPRPAKAAAPKISPKATDGNAAATTVCVIHVEKTAGVSLRTALSRQLSDPYVSHEVEYVPKDIAQFGLVSTHAPLAAYLRQDPRLQNIYVGSFRDPLARLLSMHRFARSFRPSYLFGIGDTLMGRISSLSLRDFLLSEDPALLPVVDNAIVRKYSDPADGRPLGETVSEDDLKVALERLELLNFAVFPDRLAEGLAQIGVALDMRLEPQRLNVTDINPDHDPSAFRPPPAVSEGELSQDMLERAVERLAPDLALVAQVRRMQAEGRFRAVGPQQRAGLKRATPRLQPAIAYGASSEALKAACDVGFSDDGDDVRWTVGERAMVRFRRPASVSQVRLKLHGHVPAFRDYLRARLECGEERRELLFIGDGGVFEGAVKGVVAAANASVEVTFDLPTGATEADHTVSIAFIVEDPVSAAQASGEGDTRALGLSLVSLELR